MWANCMPQFGRAVHRKMSPSQASLCWITDLWVRIEGTDVFFVPKFLIIHPLSLHSHSQSS